MYIPNKKIPVMEMFGPTIQGEGALVGARTSFIRFGLCDYKCTMCDSMHSVDPAAVKANASWLTQMQILADLQANTHIGTSDKCPWVTLSGGNPCIHDLTDLVRGLKSLGFKINVETQGTKCPEWLDLVDMITVSPKSPGMGEKFDMVVFRDFIYQKELRPKIVLKVVAFSQQDMEFALAVFEAGTMIGIDRHYISVGNSNPPSLDADVAVVAESALRAEILRSYKQLIEETVNDSRFAHVIMLPQLHVLVWGNKAEV